MIKKARQKLVSSRAYAYQWLLSGQPIAGANESTYTPMQEGRYAVMVTNEQGCASLSKEVRYTLSNQATNIAFQDEAPVMYPNPNTGKFILAFPTETTQPSNDSLLNVTVVNSYGQLVYQDNREVSTDTPPSFDLSFLPTGVYLLSIKRGNQVYVKRLMKE
jgi:peptidoglycan hydrolase-like protein with peptidoglycan-binding domain